MLERFERAVLISLPEREDRRIETKAELARAREARDVEWFSAIRPSSAAGFFSIGEHGCYKSHLEVWKRSTEFSSVIILEDDIEFSADYYLRSTQIGDLPDDWDIFYAGHMQLPECKTYFSNTGIVKIPIDAEFIGAHYYALNKKAIPKLISAAELYMSRERGHPDGGIMSIDGTMNIARQQLGLVTYAAIPALALQRSSRTDIGKIKWFDHISSLDSFVNNARHIKNKSRQIRDKLRSQFSRNKWILWLYIINDIAIFY